jgi:hypothetical protein
MRLSDQPKDSTPPKSGLRPDSAGFDQRMFARKLEELVKQNVKNFEAGRLKVFDANPALSFDIQEAYLMKVVDTDIGVLRDSFVPAVDEACRDVQRSGANDITSVFISNELVPRVLAIVNDRKAEIRRNLETVFRLAVKPSNWCLPSVLAHLSREMNDFEKDLKVRYDIEIGQLKRQESKLRLSDEGSDNLNQRTQRGEFCQRVIDEIKRIKNQCVGMGRSVAEIQNDHPDFAVWKVRESLSSEDRDTFNHPNRWGPPVGFAKNILAKTSDVSVHTITSRVKAYRKSQQPKKQS